MQLQNSNLIYKTFKNLPGEILKISSLIFLYIIFANLFLKITPIKNQIIYIFPIFFIVCIKNFQYFEKTLNWMILFFLIGIIDDILVNRIIGISSIYYVISFSVFLFLLRKFQNKAMFFYILISTGIIFIHYIYSTLSLFLFSKSDFMNDNFEINSINFSEISIFQLYSFITTLIITSILLFFLQKKVQKFEIF